MYTITIIIPVKSEKEDISILKFLDKVEYPKDSMEIILAVGNHPAIQRNNAAKIAKGDILYFFNKDVQLNENIFKRAADIINRDEKIAGVGGPDLTPSDNSYIQHLFGYAMSSYFAHWKMRARYSQVGGERITDEKELLLSNMAIRRDVYLKANGFDERLYPNEENELINRISRMGYKFIYNPEIKIYRDRRKTIFAFAKQFYRYGQGRMDQIFAEGGFKNFQFFLPVILSVYLLVLPYMKSLWPYFIPLLLYIIFGLIDAMYLSFKNRRFLLFLFPAIYIIMHVSYGIGMLTGIYKHLLIRSKYIKQQHSCNIIYIKEFERQTRNGK